MYRKVKLVEKFVSLRKINKVEIIDSCEEIRSLYESLVNDVNSKKNGNEKSKEDDKKEEDEIVVGEMSRKDKIINAIRKKTKLLKKINPKYYALIVGLIVVAFLVKKYRAKIISLLKVILNV
jgi:hypothetical protein